MSFTFGLSEAAVTYVVYFGHSNVIVTYVVYSGHSKVVVTYEAVYFSPSELVMRHCVTFF